METIKAIKNQLETNTEIANLILKALGELNEVDAAAFAESYCSDNIVVFEQSECIQYLTADFEEKIESFGVGVLPQVEAAIESGQLNETTAPETLQTLKTEGAKWKYWGINHGLLEMEEPETYPEYILKTFIILEAVAQVYNLVVSFLDTPEAKVMAENAAKDSFFGDSAEDILNTWRDTAQQKIEESGSAGILELKQYYCSGMLNDDEALTYIQRGQSMLNYAIETAIEYDISVPTSAEVDTASRIAADNYLQAIREAKTLYAAMQAYREETPDGQAVQDDEIAQITEGAEEVGHLLGDVAGEITGIESDDEADLGDAFAGLFGFLGGALAGTLTSLLNNLAEQKIEELQIRAPFVQSLIAEGIISPAAAEQQIQAIKDGMAEVESTLEEKGLTYDPATKRVLTAEDAAAIDVQTE